MKPNAGSRLLSFQLHHSEKSKVNIYRYVEPAMRLDRELKAACVLEQIYWIVGQTISQIAFLASWVFNIVPVYWRVIDWNTDVSAFIAFVTLPEI